MRHVCFTPKADIDFTHPTAALNPSRLVAREQCGTEPVNKYAAVKRGPGSMRPSPPLVEPQFIEIVSATAEGAAMGDFLTGASWGAWFVLAGIAAAGLWAFVH